jgi:hypothetical protein
MIDTRVTNNGGRRGVRAILLAGILAAVSLSAVAQVARWPEYEVKAHFLPLFSLFVTWPDTVLQKNDDPLIIGVLGLDPFGEALDNAAKTKEVLQERKIIVKRARNVKELMPCHIMFICKSEQAQLAEIFAVIEKECVLTVGEMDGFIRLGGMINFIVKKGKVRFELNPDAAQRKGLKISCQLLSLGVKADS